MSDETSASGWNGEPFNADEDDDTADVWKDASKPADGLPAFVDEDIADELDVAGPPDWLGIRWRDIDDTDRAEAWTGLRQWVDWFIREYNLNTSQVTPCWYEHADIVAELYAAMCAEYKTWDEGMPGLAPMTTWHPHVQALKARFAEMISARQCAATKTHVRDEPDLPFTYDQDAWTRIRDGIVSTMDLPRHGTAHRWRPVTTAADGTTITGRELLVGGSAGQIPAGFTAETLLSGAAASTFSARHTLHGAAENHWEHTPANERAGWSRYTPATTTEPHHSQQLSHVSAATDDR